MIGSIIPVASQLRFMALDISIIHEYGQSYEMHIQPRKTTVAINIAAKIVLSTVQY